MNRQVMIIAGLVTVGVLVLYYLFVWGPKNDDIAALEEQIETTRTQQDQARTQITRLRSVRERAPEIEAQIAAANAVIPPDAGLPGALRQLQLAADGAGVELPSISPGRPDQGTGARSMSLNVQIRGSYFQIIDFLRRVADPSITPRAILFSSISVTPGEYPTLTASLNGAMFTREVEVAAEQPENPPNEGGDEDVDVDVNVEEDAA